MSLFPKAVGIVLEAEGVFSDHPNDPGGPSKYGISQKAYPKLNIHSLTIEQAKAIYMADYWLRNGCDKLPWWAALTLFDASVNQGPRPAARMLQQSVKVFQDGVIGPMSVKAVCIANPEDTMATYQMLRAYRYMDTPNFETFGRGWFRRLMKISAHAMKDIVDG